MTFKRYWLFFRRVLGVVLIGAAVWVGYWWYYQTAPAIRRSDGVWKTAHSVKARWEEEQKNYRRNNASPDLCFGGDMIGYYGDTSWCLWLIDKMYGGKDFRVCGCTETALMFMTNQESESWENWKGAHQAETQEEWIRYGFAQRGITVHLPPEPEDTVPLLEVLGCRTWTTLWNGVQGTNDTEGIPDYIQYNAFRWLRDSGWFNPTAFAGTNEAAFASQDVRVGLVRYMSWHSSFRKRDGLGILAFGEKPDDFCYSVWENPSSRHFWLYLFFWIFPVGASVAGIILLLPKRKAIK